MKTIQENESRHENAEAAPRTASARESLRPRNPFDVTKHERVVVLGTVFGGLLAALVLGFVFLPEHTAKLTGLVVGSFFFAGKFLPLMGFQEDWGFSPYELGFVIWVMDTCTVLIMVYSFEALLHRPTLGPWLDKLQVNARLVLRAYPRIRKAAIAGVVLFVLFPIAGTGAVGGTLIGALLGMHRFVLIGAVSLGGFLGGMAMAFATVHFRELVESLWEHRQDPWLIAAIILGIAATALFAFWGMTRAYRRAIARARDEDLRESQVFGREPGDRGG